MEGPWSGVIFNTESEPGNLRIVKMNAVSVVVMGGIGFHGIGDLVTVNGIMGSIISAPLIKYLSAERKCAITKGAYPQLDS